MICAHILIIFEFKNSNFQLGRYGIRCLFCPDGPSLAISNHARAQRSLKRSGTKWGRVVHDYAVAIWDVVSSPFVLRTRHLSRHSKQESTVGTILTNYGV
jgi:hypothetical protein